MTVLSTLGECAELNQAQYEKTAYETVVGLSRTHLQIRIMKLRASDEYAD
jgi:hypothetical protein